MELSAQTHFRHGWKTGLMGDVAGLGIDTIRDSIAWHQVESKQGKYNFNHDSASWVNKALNAGLDVILVFDPHNKHYDNGKTVFSNKGVEGFADFVVATLKHFPGITKIEIANEYNGNRFVSGKVENAPDSERDDYYHKMVAAIDQALASAGIDVEVFGGSTHSVPVDYISKLGNNGTLDMLDGVSIHPYTTAPEQFADQLTLLRSKIGAEMDIHVTEFADFFDSYEEASAYLAKMVAIMADNDVASANWYAFAKQSAFPNMELWNQHKDAPTLSGVTFAIMEDLLADGPEVSEIELDNYTYFYTFGDNAAIIWGEARSATLADGVTAYDLAGQEIEDFGWLSPDMPVILRSDSAITADSIAFGSNYLLADSFHDFDLSNGSGALDVEASPWSYHVENGNGRVFAIETQGGDLGGGQPWTPYLGKGDLQPLQIGPTSVTPVDFSVKNKLYNDFSTVERFTSQADGRVTIRGSWDVGNHSNDGVRLTIRHNDKVIFEHDIADKANGYEFDLELTGIRLKTGDTLDFVIFSRGDSQGDVTTRRIQIYENDVPFAADHVPVSYVPVLPVYEPPMPDNPFDRSDAGGSVKLQGSAGDDLIIGGDGNDRLVGRGGADSIVGGKGNDKIFASAEDVFIDGGAGRDSLYVLGNKGMEIDLAAASLEWARGGKGADVFDGSASDSRLVLKGGAGGDTLYGGSRADVLDGDEGYDWLFGGDGNDLLRGGAGHDTLDGGAGNDTLEGGSGRDVFHFEAGFGHDLIKGFAAGDMIDLSDIAGIDGRDDLDIAYTKSNAIISIGEDTIVVQNMRMGDLGDDDFLF